MAQCVECHPFALLVISLSLLTQFAFSTKVYLMVLQPRSTIPSPDHFYRHRKKTQLANLLNWPILLSKLCLQERTAAMLCRVMVWYTADETQLAYSQQIKSGYPVQYDLFVFEYYFQICSKKCFRNSCSRMKQYTFNSSHCVLICT